MLQAQDTSDGFFSGVLKIFSRINLYLHCANIMSHIDWSIGQKFLSNSSMVVNPLITPRLCWAKETLYVVLGLSLFHVDAFICCHFVLPNRLSVEEVPLLWLGLVTPSKRYNYNYSATTVGLWGYFPLRILRTPTLSSKLLVSEQGLQ